MFFFKCLFQFGPKNIQWDYGFLQAIECDTPKTSFFSRKSFSDKNWTAHQMSS